MHGISIWLKTVRIGLALRSSSASDSAGLSRTLRALQIYLLTLLTYTGTPPQSYGTSRHLPYRAGFKGRGPGPSPPPHPRKQRATSYPFIIVSYFISGSIDTHIVAYDLMHCWRQELFFRILMQAVLFIMKIVHEVQETKKSAKRCKVLVCAQANNELFNVTESRSHLNRMLLT